MVDPINGQIIRISNEYEVLIDKGTKDGVKYGDIFIIYDEGEEIFDLSGKSLGKLEIVKGRVKVEHAQENFSICGAYRRKTVLNPVVANSVVSLLSSYQRNVAEETEVLPLDVDKSYLRDLDKGPHKIKVGDLVKKEIS